MRVYFVLDDEVDEDLIGWWLSIPKGQRAEEIRRILRWYVVPGGFADLVRSIRRNGQPAPPPDPAPDLIKTLNAQLRKFGWDDDDE